jgi:hypothetical protein
MLHPARCVQPLPVGSSAQNEAGRDRRIWCQATAASPLAWVGSERPPTGWALRGGTLVEAFGNKQDAPGVRTRLEGEDRFGEHTGCGTLAEVGHESVCGVDECLEGAVHP